MGMAEVVAEQIGLFRETGRLALGDFFTQRINGVTHRHEENGGAANGGVERPHLGLESDEPGGMMRVTLSAERGARGGIAGFVSEGLARSALAGGP